MNKLYIIKFKLRNGYTISTWSAWSVGKLEEKKTANPEWTFMLAEDNDIHQVWEAI